MYDLRKIYAVCLCLVISVGSVGNALSTDQHIDRPDLMSVFAQYEVNGTFVLFDPLRKQLTFVNPDRAKVRMIPASTFKIANSLIALETKTIADENEVIPYGGKPQPFKMWERDMSIRQGIKVSNVPVFQELASRIGKEKYEKFLTLLNYGNREVGATTKTFWLEGPLKISAVEQVKFLADLATKNLPLSDRSQDIVAKITRLERNGKRILHGKTGWTSAANPQLGWFVGWVKNEKGVFAFATNIDITSKSDAPKRKQITKKLLKKLGIF